MEVMVAKSKKVGQLLPVGVDRFLVFSSESGGVDTFASWEAADSFAIECSRDGETNDIISIYELKEYIHRKIEHVKVA
jgi:hypothetical protein